MIGLPDVFKVGIGPPSLHTAGPMKAGKQFVDDLVEKGLLDSVTRIAVDVYGLLLLTGKGHHTGIATIMSLAGNEPVTVNIDSTPGFIRDVETRGRLLLAQGQYGVDFPQNDGMRFHNGNLPLHENGIQIHAYNGETAIYNKTYYSVGGGFIVDEEHFGQDAVGGINVPYPLKSATRMLEHCNSTGLSLSGMAMQNELALYSEKEIEKHLGHARQAMQACTDRGMNTEGVSPDPLRVPRCALALCRMLTSSDKLSNDPMNMIDWVNMFALVVNKENAAGGRVVTAPTNGACSIVPAVLAYYDHFIESVSPDIYTRYFLMAGAVGVLYKMNASISDAEVGYQGEVGVACSMVAVGLAELLGASPEQVCVVAETGVEHNLGLTCDPATGQVQVPCIERNATASVKAIDAAHTATCRTSVPRVSLGKVIETTYETGKGTNAKYRETSRDGLTIKVRCD